MEEDRSLPLKEKESIPGWLAWSGLGLLSAPLLTRKIIGKNMELFHLLKKLRIVTGHFQFAFFLLVLWG